MAQSAATIVSRIAFLCSETVVHGLAANFSLADEHRRISRRNANGPQYAKQFSKDDKLLSVSILSSSKDIIQLLPHLPQLASSPVVVHVEVDGDLSDVLLLRSAVPYILHSTSEHQAHDNALIASKLALSERKAVIHVFQAVGPGDLTPVEELPECKIRDLLASASDSTSLKANVENFIADGRGNGHAIGYANGHANGHSKEVSSLAPSKVNDPDSSESFFEGDDLAIVRLYYAFESASLATAAVTQRAVLPLSYRGSSDPHTVVFVVGQCPIVEADGVKWVNISLLNPILSSHILRHLRPRVRRVLVFEQVYHWNLKWTPLYLDVVAAIQFIQDSERPTIQSAILGYLSSVTPSDVRDLLEDGLTQPRRAGLPVRLGKPVVIENGSVGDEIPSTLKHESSYTKILAQLFSERLEISNSPELMHARGNVASTPEFALGSARRQLEARAELIRLAQEFIHSDDVSENLRASLSKWLLVNSSQNQQACADVLKALDDVHAAFASQSVSAISALRSNLSSKSHWIIGSDAWSYDVGSSGLHHLIASGLNVNILIIDSIPYSYRNNNTDPMRRKRDVGLYAMNHGDVYVASVAVYSSYTQVLQALVEADRFNGPSVILAYLPYASADTPALEVLKETKLAVDSGYWPLYRWDPSKESAGKEPFSLDSDAIKQELRDFLDRQNHLSQLTRSKPEFATELVNSLGENVREARRQRAQQVYQDLVSNISAAPLLILYASDGGGAEKKAKRFAARGRARGLATMASPMDAVSIEDVAKQEYVVFMTSVAGQGESPQNGRKFMKALNSAIARGERPFTPVKFAVFGMGDSHYWPRSQDAHYYNKAGKDLNVRLELLGGERFVDLRLGDDQDEDGSETGYKLWEPLVWKALSVDTIEVREVEPDPITFEHMKVASNYLRGTIAEWLEDSLTIPMAPSDVQVAKFHGVYQQDDRDIRDERQAQGVDPAYSFMIRVRMPAGVCTSDQWLVLDQIADEYGNGTFKVTTRQTFQFHGVIKRHLKSTIQAINRSLLDTLVACGDAIRNILCSAIPSMSKLHSEVYEFAQVLSDKFLPNTTAYHEIWLDKKLVAGHAVQDVEPFYGRDYLPRKFKVAIAVPPTNDVDVFAHDLGLITIVDEEGHLEGFNVLAGGGMGVTHGNKKTYPRLASTLGFCTVDQAHAVAEKVMLFQRDNGNRSDRKNARLMYTIDRIGLETFKAEIEKLLGWSFPPARPYIFDRNIDDFGWSQNENGNLNFMMFIENGRIQDVPDREFKTALRDIAKVHKGTFRLTANQHLMLADVPPGEVAQVKSVLAKYGLDNLDHSGLRLSSSACVSFPTCGLAMAESERYLPLLINKVEVICEENGLRSDSIVMRMSGCPNGCSRPYLGEIAFVGKAPGTYLMLLGGGYHGQRLNKIYRESVTESEILSILKPMIKHYSLERLEGEHFGDFVIRAGYILPTLEGKAWYEGSGGSGKYREISIE